MARVTANALGPSFRPYLLESSRNQFLACLFLALSFADLLTTYLLLQISPHFYEANPVADWAFQKWNILGMTIYKFAIVGTVVAICEVIERNRSGWGRIVLCLGIVATALVFYRGISLYRDWTKQAAATSQEVAEGEQW